MIRMKKVQTLVQLPLLFCTALALLLLVGCSKNKFETGIKGTIEYAKGDCMPPVNQGDLNYKKYRGDIYFIVKEDLDNLLDNGGNINELIDDLKNNSIMVKVRRGKLSAELPVGTYLVMPEDLYLNSDQNTITIKPGEVLNEDFKFLECTTW